MIRHELSIDLDADEIDLTATCSECGAYELPMGASWDEAYDLIVSEHHGLPDDHIALPDTPNWLESEAQHREELRAS